MVLSGLLRFPAAYANPPFLLAAGPSGAGGATNPPHRDRSLPPEEDDYSGTAFTDYGEFNQEDEEDKEIRFLQYGRLFGVSVGAGMHGVLGNRGKLYEGGIPMIEVKLHYWFDFQLALDMGFFTASHHFKSEAPTTQGNVNVGLTHIGVDLKYYFDVKNLSAPISFANPYIMAGVGTYTKTENYLDLTSSAPNTDTGFSLSGGVGLEFVISPKRSFFELEAKIHTANFKDNNIDIYQVQQVDNLNGAFFTVTGGLLFTY